MLTANRSNLHETIALGRQLLANRSNNNGRVLRRFIDRACDDGGCRVNQVFAHNGHYTEMQLLALVDYAKSVAQLAKSTLAPEGGVFVETVYEPLAALVKNSYRLAHPPKEATVAQLRSMVDMVVDLCVGMLPFAKDANATAFQDCPDYVYRGLPCSCSETLWEIGGSDKADGGGGVLEWCVDPDDAQQRLAMMSQFPRFENLSARPWTESM